ncbi:MAG: hypothetical protein AABX13_04050, partial [Nanoarchaeota archaeon]
MSRAVVVTEIRSLVPPPSSTIVICCEINIERRRGSRHKKERSPFCAEGRSVLLAPAALFRGKGTI